MIKNTSQENAYPIGKYPAVNQDTFPLARATAIQAYANLEFSLSMMFSRWLGAKADLGGLVFVRSATNNLSAPRYSSLSRNYKAPEAPPQPSGA